MTNDDKVRLVTGFFTAFAEGDKEFIEAHITGDFSFSAPPDPLLDRSGYFERCWPGAGNHQQFDLQRTIVNGDEVLVTYEIPHGDGTKGRNTEIFTLAGGKVKRVEVYFGWNT